MFQIAQRLHILSMQRLLLTLAQTLLLLMVTISYQTSWVLGQRLKVLDYLLVAGEELEQIISLTKQELVLLHLMLELVVTGVATATSFSGSGANVTNLNATQLASGTIPDARFPTTLPAVSGENLTNLNIPAGFNELDAALFN